MVREKQVIFDIAESLKNLEKSLESASDQITESFHSAIRSAAEAAYASIVAKAQSELNSTRGDYLRGLSFEALDDNSFLITLDGKWPNALEDGFAAYNLTEKLLQSKKVVDVGSRAGQPWVQQSKPRKGKASHKFAHVPFERQPFAKAGQAGDLAKSIQAMKATNAKGELQKITSVFKDPSGRPLEGRVAVAHPSTVSNPMLEGLTKYQSLGVDSRGKEVVRSVYMTFRTISEIGKPWIHPGFKGLHAFEEAERDIDAQIMKIINTFL